MDVAIDVQTIAVVAAVLGVVGTVIFAGIGVLGIRALQGLRDEIRRGRDS